ncbi:embryonic polyadenylate-binding protein [Phtheirospermum japonicum]|uniref:Embryonic polyadenylate-binding protein n=1 Tax=Phtheirospermum japonicum TaxID=374723 RepID=A0A830CDY0_9LAMI|nr:embryonic polyadenylate-binding protein [Phtheirospermum japonicum]
MHRTLDRVENVLQVITDAESSKMILDAIQSSTHAFKENQISVEEVEACLEEVAENIDSLKQLDKALRKLFAFRSIRPIKGFWIITYASEDEAEKAITQMNGKPLNGRVIFVDYAKPRSGSSSGMPISKGPPEPTPHN